MKEKIHPTFYDDAVVVCSSCGATWTTGSTKKQVSTEVCSNCHPFYTGQQQRLLDREGQVDRFYKRLQVRQNIVDEQKARANAQTSPERPVSELAISSRAIAALEKAGITNVGQLIAKMGEGKVLLEVEGFGRKSLIDAKKQLRGWGYQLPDVEETSA